MDMKMFLQKWNERKSRMIEAVQLYEKVLEQLDMTKEVDDEELTAIIHQSSTYLSIQLYLSKVTKLVFSDMN